MAKFLCVHPIGKELTENAAAPVAKAVKANVTVDAYWIKSWYVREEGKLYCEWDAKDAESVRKATTKAAPDFPIEGIYKIDMVISGEDFR